MEFSRKVAVWVSIAAAVIFVAAFMPWGEVRVSSPTPGGWGFGDDVFGGMRFTLTLTGWNGSVTLGCLKVPNWLVVLVATGAAAVEWLRVGGVWAAPTFAPFTLAGYGLLHSVFALAVLGLSSEGSVGVGVLFTAGAFAGMLGMFVWRARGVRVTRPAEPGAAADPAS